MKRIFFAIPIVVAGYAAWKLLTPSSVFSPLQSQSPAVQNTALSQPEVVAQGLDTPWAIAFLPNDVMLVTERKGTVQKREKGKLAEGSTITVPGVQEVGEGGLLGIAAHPDFTQKPFVYFYLTARANGENTTNQVVRMRYQNGALSQPEVILNNIPGASNHNGGRIAFGPDKHLYIGTGDAQEPSRAQDTKSLAGKILRVTDEGKPVAGNPFNNEVYSYGHRNVQGLAWDPNGQLFATEHGRSGIRSGLDELNIIMAGKNYGWPEIEGTETSGDMVVPAQNSGASDTWAPSGMAFHNSHLYFAGLRGQALYQSEVINGQPQPPTPLFKNEYGRIREVIMGPNNMLYFTTSNYDGRGAPKEGDDKVMRIQL